MLDDRLWDKAGNEWALHVRWIDADQTRQFLRREQEVALAGGGQGVTWLTASEARDLWRHARRHFEVPGRSAAAPNDESLTYAAKLWHRDQDRLLMLQTFC
ncbi:MAG TPA: hypothetical protein VI357_05085 [Mycobacteriales bacterium]